MTMQMPELDALRNEAIFAGALDPMSLRFQIVEYDKSSGEMLGVPCDDIGFREAIETTAGLIERRRDSHFCLPACWFYPVTENHRRRPHLKRKPAGVTEQSGSACGAEQNRVV